MTTDPTITLPASDLRETVAYLVFRAVCVGDEDRAAALAVADQILTEVAKAAAREDVPALVAEVRRVRTELATARATDPAPATPPEPARTYEPPAADLLEIVDLAAGRAHSRDGVVARTLARVLAVHDARVRADERARVAELLRKVAAGRREYAGRASVDVREVLEAEAGMAESAAQIAEGELKPLYALLPSWRWTPEMEAALASAHAATEGDSDA